MKRHLLAIAFLFSLSVNSQTTTFNLGWNGTPEKILCVGDTWIVYAHSSYGTGYSGDLLKYQKVGDEYQIVGQLGLPENLNDFRFVDDKLRVVAFNDFACDYYPKILRYYEIDTASFTVIKSDIIDQNVELIQAGFATDSTIFSWTDDFNSDSIIYNVNTGIKSVHGLSGLIGIGDTLDFVASVFNDKFLFVHSAVLAAYFMVPVDVDNINLTRAFAAPYAKVKAVYSYLSDSLIAITGQNIHKLDTNFSSISTHPIPSFHSLKILNNKLFLVNNYGVLTYSLPDLQIVSSDSLNGLSSGFKMKDAYPDGGNLSILAAMDNTKSGLYQTVLKSDITSTGETARHEITLDSSAFVQSQYLNGKQVNTYDVYVSNSGADTIHYFNVQFAHLDLWQCGFYDYSEVKLTIAPGETKNFTKQVRIQKPGNVCFYASAADNRLEDNLNDNETCVSASIGLKENNVLSRISIYPNPAVSEFHVEGDLKDVQSIQLFSLDGRQIELDIISSTDTKVTVNLDGLPKGIYFLQLKEGGETLTQKVIKE